MARTLSYKTPRKTETDNEHQYLGKIIVFCEGKTEGNYFDYFKNCLKRNKYNDFDIVIEDNIGNARGVLNYANEFLDNEENSKKYELHDKYLVFDCDAPKDIQNVINDVNINKNEYKLLITNLLIETWLMMHFMNVDKPMSKSNSYENMAKFLGIDFYGSKQKANEGTIRKVVDGDNVIKAIENAEILEQMYKEKNLSIYSDIDKMNPYTSVHTLIKLLIEHME